MHSCLLLSAVFAACNAAEWGYVEDAQDGTKGPRRWAEDHESCSGSRQSPIVLIKPITVVNESLISEPLTFDEGYEKELEGGSFVIENNGHTFQVGLNEEVAHQAHITGGGLPAQYTLKQFHFHWAKDNHEGSEHVFGSDERPLEVHFVHTKNDMEIADAILEPDGLAVIGIAYKLGKESDRDTELDKFITHLNEIRFKGSSTTVEESLKLSGLLPPKEGWQDFYRYEGSLTTPPCSEAVLWTLLLDAPVVSERQLHEFRLLFSNTEDKSPVFVEYNFRPVQPVNDRKVYCTSQKMLDYLDDSAEISADRSGSQGQQGQGGEQQSGQGQGGETGQTHGGQAQAGETGQTHGGAAGQPNGDQGNGDEAESDAPLLVQNIHLPGETIRIVHTASGPQVHIQNQQPLYYQQPLPAFHYPAAYGYLW